MSSSLTPPHLAQSIAKYLDTVWREAFEAGRVAGYQDGWAAATAAMIEAAEAKRIFGPSTEKSNAQSAPATPTVKAAVNLVGSSTTSSRTYIEAALTAKPGMKPMEVVHWATERYPGVNRHTILMQIKRMRRNKEFVARDDSSLYLVKSTKEAA